jgi:hypothetical protein
MKTVLNVLISLNKRIKSYNPIGLSNVELAKSINYRISDQGLNL